jgi:hypothetical protein
VSNFSENKKQKYDFYEVIKRFLLTGAQVQEQEARARQSTNDVKALI